MSMMILLLQTIVDGDSSRGIRSSHTRNHRFRMVRWTNIVIVVVVQHCWLAHSSDIIEYRRAFTIRDPIATTSGGGDTSNGSTPTVSCTIVR